MTDLVVRSPVDGWALSLDEVPDDVFSGRLLGDGIAVEPLGAAIHAPFDGVVGALARARHAVSIRSDSGVEVLIHVGLETVKLEGDGFTAHVAEGDRVAAGDLLLTLDLDRIARGAVSLITPIVVTGEGFALHGQALDRRVRVGDPLMTVSGAAGVRDDVGPVSDVITREVGTALPHGLHARPAGRIAARAKAFDARVLVHLRDRQASAASAVQLMALGLREGDSLTLSATGADARAAVDTLADLIAGGLGDGTRTTPPQPILAPSPDPIQSVDGELILAGVAAAPGLAVGQAVRFALPAIEVPVAGLGEAVESPALERAVAAVRQRLETASTSGDVQRRSILAAHLAFLDDPELLAAARQSIAAGHSAGHGWREATRVAVDLLRSIGDTRMAERADDLLDLERQVLLQLTGVEPQPLALGPGSIVLADDLLPSQLMALDAGQLAGICTNRGGPTSHVAILAAAMGVPALVAVGPGLSRVADGSLVVLDADGRRLVASPSAATQARAQSAMAARGRRRAEARAAATDDCRTADGVRIEVFANLGAASEAAPAVADGAEGCGLLRTEFLFLERETAPDEDEQLDQYQSIADALDGRTLVIRTLDAGGDKPLPYLPMPAEDNPALGLRGVRSGLYRPDLLLAQLRAICRVRSPGVVAVMLPMVASAAEVRQVRALLDRAVRETGAEAPLLGVMVETPAAAMTTARLSEVVDFISVGTNDLTQYTLAMDRQNPHLAPQLDALHPAVLRLIQQAVAGATDARWIGVCGGLASEIEAAPILVGLGVTELSAAPAMIAEIKAVVRRFTLAECQALAREALEMDGPEAVRALAGEAVRDAIPSRKVGARA
ncbi:MAG: phosphoenolpyruvate--protein phosphotransferase [Brevundimonas sp.]|uniref:phosphoenolpyruvate--protein phosphotransferase n=1 Tax=Brevundimonas sp. TaxID=1871086 RepID=UPI00391BFAC0